MSPFILSQILICLAICCDFLSFQFKERTRILTILMVSCLLIGSHFALLEQWTAASLAMVSALRFLVSTKTTSRRAMWCFVALSLVVAVFTYSGLLSLLAFAGSLFGTVGTFCRHDKRLRQFMLVGTSIWLVNNVLVGSPMAVLMESMFIGSNLLGYYRFYIRPKSGERRRGVGADKKLQNRSSK